MAQKRTGARAASRAPQYNRRPADVRRISRPRSCGLRTDEVGARPESISRQAVEYKTRRDAREAEGAPLLREYRVKSSIEGSNPSLSASHCKTHVRPFRHRWRTLTVHSAFVKD